MLIAIIPVIAMIIGILLWALASNGKVQEAGRITFACGTLVLIYIMGHHSVRIG